MIKLGVERMKITHNATGGNLLDYVQLFLEPQKTLYYLFSTFAVILDACNVMHDPPVLVPMAERGIGTNSYSALWKKLKENKSQRELPRKKERSRASVMT